MTVWYHGSIINKIKKIFYLFYSNESDIHWNEYYTNEYYMCYYLLVAAHVWHGEENKCAFF